MRIVYATDNYWPRVSGMAVSVDTFRRELEALGHEVHVLAPEYPGSAEFDAKHDRTHVHRFKSWGLFFSKEDRLVKASEERAVFALLDRIRPDVVHVQTELLMGRAAWRYAIAKQLPLVITAHTDWEDYINNYLPFPPVVGRAVARGIMRRVHQLADVVVTPSHQMQEIISRYGLTRPIEVIPTGFEASAFQGIDRAKARQDSFLFERFPQLRGRTVLLTVGRVAQEKNLGFLLDVVERLKGEHPELAWLNVGDGPSLAGLKRDAAGRGLDPFVVMPGYVTREQVKDVYALADLFVFASKTETQGLATMEALGTGLPVVALDEMGTRDVLRGNAGGFLVRDDVELFADAVRRLVEDPLLYRRKADEAARAALRWSARAKAEELVAVYERVAAGRITRKVRVSEERAQAVA